jgi:magnesium transporter
VYEHIIQVIETTESFREVLSNIFDIYQSSVANKMNEVMKVLTVIATIIMPMTLVSGIYGMNFEHMPELSWPWGYPFALGLMGLLAGGMLAYFRKKKWF